MKSLVVGASGFAGSHLLARLIDLDRAVTATSTSGRPGRGAGQGASWRKLDISDRPNVRRVLRAVKPDVVYLLGAMALPGACERDPRRALEVNALGPAHVAGELAACRPGARLLLVSSSTVIESQARGAPVNLYAATKDSGEQMARAAASEIELVIARPYQHFGPGQPDDYFMASMARQLAELELLGERRPVLETGNLAVKRSLSPVADIVDAYVALADRGVPGRAYAVAGTQPRALSSTLERLIACAVVSPRLRRVRTRVRPGELDTPRIDLSPLRRDTAWRPQRDTDEALAGLLSWWRTRVRRARR